MLHHVGIEVVAENTERTIELFQLLGFELVEPPATLSEFTWLEQGRTQVHLMPSDAPTVPPRGHTAVVVSDFESTFAALAERGFEVERRREHWAAARAVVLTPDGHRVELMAQPPSADAETVPNRK